MQWTQAIAEKRLNDLKISDLPIVSIRPHIVPVDHDWFQRYRTICREFMHSLSDSVQELALMNLDRNEFMNLLMGRKIPDNLSIRFRIPLIWGGKLEPNNLFMCFTFPQSQNIDRFIIEQSGNETIWLPNPVKKIYMPIHSTISGTGGNAASDRLSQMAASIAANRRNP
ncbi:MAG: hypothetical protein J6S80_00590 [Alphaproteobacteria bacterium]|nr:hypothetical protein [Alphaproteobacteria bacterium]